MAYLNGEMLVTQGDQELATISNCVGLVGDIAPFLFDATERADQFRKLCVEVAGTLAMTFMLTPSDPEDEAPTPRNYAENPVLAPTFHDMIPEYGKTEHTFSGGIATLMIGALRFRVETTPIDEKEERQVVEAALILEQLNI